MKIQKLDEFNKINESYNGAKLREEASEFIASLGEPITDIHEIEKCFEAIAKTNCLKWYWPKSALQKCNPAYKQIISDFYRCEISENTPITDKLVESISKIIENGIINNLKENDKDTYERCNYDADEYLKYYSLDDYTIMIRNAEISISFKNYDINSEHDTIKKGLYIYTLSGQPEPDIDKVLCTPFIEKCIDEMFNAIYDFIDEECSTLKNEINRTHEYEDRYGTYDKTDWFDNE